MTDLPSGPARDPSGRIEETFRRIFVERMAGHPFVNPELEVDAVGFRLWKGHWFGVLITPWFLNLIAVPGTGDGWNPYVEGGVQDWVFPGGTHTFRSDREDPLGEYQSCPILPSVVHLPDHDHARRAAEALMRILFEGPATEPALPERPAAGTDPSEDGREGAGKGASMARLLTRRSFLRGAMFRD